MDRARRLSVVLSDRRRSNGHNHRRFHLNLRRLLLTDGQLSDGTGSPERSFINIPV